LRRERNHRLGSKSRGKLDIKLEEAAAIANAEEIGIKLKPFLAAHMPLKHSRIKGSTGSLKESLPG